MGCAAGDRMATKKAKSDTQYVAVGIEEEACSRSRACTSDIIIDNLACTVHKHMIMISSHYN